MSFRLSKLNLSLLLIALLTALLATLAALQYRWIGEVSSAEQERIRAHIRAAADNFSRDFDREITRAFLLLQIDPITYEKKMLDNYAARYQSWQTTTPYTKIVSKVFLADKNERAELRISVYNEATQHFEESDWSLEFQKLQNQIEQDLNGQNPTNKEKISRPPPIIATPELMALIIPISKLNLLNLDQIQTAAGNGVGSSGTIKQEGYTIILLDSDYIKGELLPSLVDRYFNSAGNSDRYDVTVSSLEQPTQIFYQSGMQSHDQIEEEYERNFFGLRFDEIDNLLPAKNRQAHLPAKNSGSTEKPQF